MYKFLLSFFCLSTLNLFQQVGPRGWQDHLSINSSNSVSKSGNTVYASYGAGIVRVDEKEKAPKALNKISGLSDVGVRILRSNPYNKKTLVIYENSNIDVIDANENLRNYPDIKLKSLNGKKLINEVTFQNHLAYLSCGFGIIVFDTEKLEIKDTYIIGPNASNLEVLQVALNDSLIFAATPVGIYRANYKTKILNNFKNWTYDTLDLPKGLYGGIVNCAGQILTAYTPSQLNAADKGKDFVYRVSSSNTWEKYPSMSGTTILKLGPSYDDQFSIIDEIGLLVIKVGDGSIVTHINSFNGNVSYGQLRDAAIGKDYTGNYTYWLASNRYGLYQTYNGFYTQNKVTRNGMNSSTMANIDVLDGKVAVSPSLIDNAGIGNFSREGINILEEQEWKYLQTLDSAGAPIIDVTSVLFDRQDKSTMWVASWGLGVAKYTDNKQVRIYTPANSPMPKMPGTIGEARCSGLSMDKNGNLWFAHSDQKRFLGVITKKGEYRSFEFESGRFTRKTFADRNGNIWMLHERDGGITVFKPFSNNNVFNTPQQGVNYRVLNNAPGSGNLESNSVYTIAEDQDGRMWIGTSAGIRVIYNPNAIFTGSDYDAQPIKIVQDGNVELLLGKETVTSIIVDGANNKWVGTLLGGVYCFTPDGLSQLYHFTEENSPLYSNTIVDINYNEVTGDVFIGTDKGLQSFRSLIVAGEEQFSNVIAYPNPVKPGFQGAVMIRGLMDNSIVKIADESGNLVWETKATGGQIEWNIKTLGGVRVATGVYLVYASTTDGTSKAVTKILVVN